MEKGTITSLNQGFVTSTEVTHATPGALYAHSYDRYFQRDSDLAEEDTPEGVHDIAWQLVNREPGKYARMQKLHLTVNL